MIDGRDSCGYGRKDGEVGGFRNSLKKHHREIDGAYGSYDGAVARRDGSARERGEKDGLKVRMQEDRTGVQWGKRDGWNYKPLNS